MNEPVYVIRLGKSLFVRTGEDGIIGSVIDSETLQPESYYSTNKKEDAEKIAERIGGVVDIKGKVKVEPSCEMTMKKLLTLQFEMKDEYLKSTPFYSKRNTITKEYLLKVPTYRLIKVLERIQEDYQIKNFDEYLKWIQFPLNEYDESFPSVRNFRRQYGSFRANRYLLTLKNSIELYLNTKE